MIRNFRQYGLSKSFIARSNRDLVMVAVQNWAEERQADVTTKKSKYRYFLKSFNTAEGI